MYTSCPDFSDAFRLSAFCTAWKCSPHANTGTSLPSPPGPERKLPRQTIPSGLSSVTYCLSFFRLPSSYMTTDLKAAPDLSSLKQVALVGAVRSCPNHCAKSSGVSGEPFSAAWTLRPSREIEIVSPRAFAVSISKSSFENGGNGRRGPDGRSPSLVVSAAGLGGARACFSTSAGGGGGRT